MKVLLWHGYLLTGSGSNLYTANLARVWRALGHDVLLLCQQREGRAVPFVDEDGDFRAGNRDFDIEPTGAAPAEGRCRVVRPNIGTVLPVYVYDHYEGFEAKRFVDLTDEELSSYTSDNVAALTTAIERFEPDAIITGHEVMGPYIAREACKATGTTYLAKLHGSALEYAVKEQARYLSYAEAGLRGARVVAGGSAYMVEAASTVISGWRDRAAVVNPGCDVDLFKPIDRSPDSSPVVGYVGKLIAAKGVHNLLAALGLTSTPGLSAVVVGYGGFERGLHDLWQALRASDLDAATQLAATGEHEPLPALLEFLQRDPGESYFGRIREVEASFPGRLEHGPLARALPTFDVLVVPSVVPEAFGMVAAEAAACGVLPIVPAHSGIGEAGATIERELDAPGLLTFDPARPIDGIATAIDRVLSIPAPDRREMGAAAGALARRVWSWEHVAEELLRLATPGPT